MSAASPPLSMPRLLLASTSRYRAELLARLRLPFSCEAPRVDEAQLTGESPIDLARRLALAKAGEVAQRHADAVVIGSDQVAELGGQAIGKPGDHQRAVAQLRVLQGRQVAFHTAVAVLRPARDFAQSALVTVTVRFRPLSDKQIERYLRCEQPYDCAGSAKCEALGIALLESIVSDDPTALIGLPLIRTCSLLTAAGIDPLEWAQ